MDKVTDLRVLGLEEDEGVDCRFVRTSSNGEAIVEMNVLAVMPAKRGVEADVVIKRGKTECRR
jgi:hypothetical protein